MHRWRNTAVLRLVCARKHHRQGIIPEQFLYHPQASPLSQCDLAIASHLTRVHVSNFSKLLQRHTQTLFFPTSHFKIKLHIWKRVHNNLISCYFVGEKLFESTNKYRNVLRDLFHSYIDTYTDDASNTHCIRKMIRLTWGLEEGWINTN